MRARLEAIVRAFAGPDAGAIGDATTFHGLGFDSTDMIALVLDVEQLTGVRLPDQAIVGLSDFGALVRAVEAEWRRGLAPWFEGAIA